MGILYLAAYLRVKFDLDILLVNQRVENHTNQDLIRLAADFRADIVGFGCLTPASHALPELTLGVRKRLPNALIMLGGPHASSFGPGVLRDTAADVAVNGEGELTFEAVVHAWKEGSDFSSIPGLMWRDRSSEVITNPGPSLVIQDLDSLPFPAYDLIDLSRYWRLQSMPPIPRRRYASLVSSRGCTYRCSWCHDVFGRKFRAHSPERIVDEIQYYSDTYGIRDFEFLDDIFNHKRQRMIDFSELITQRGLRTRLAFPNGIRTDTLTKGDVDALVSAGTYFCSFALESGSPRIQEEMGKRLNIPRFLQGVEWSAKQGVFTNGFMMLGFPTETAAEMQQTIDVASNSALHTASFFTATPFPNTKLHDIVRRTQPEKLDNLNYDDKDFATFPFNLSAEPDQVFFHFQRKANRQFYAHPRRLYRILRDFPQPHLLPLYAPILLGRLTKGLLGREGG